jgi:hypothetical protein
VVVEMVAVVVVVVASVPGASRPPSVPTGRTKLCPVVGSIKTNVLIGVGLAWMAVILVGLKPGHAVPE